MPQFKHRSTARTLAFAMLAIWLLALGVGIANACLLHADGGRHGAAPLGASPDSWASVGARLSADPGAADDARHDTQESACAEFCALEQASLVKQKADAFAHHPLAPGFAPGYALAHALRGLCRCCAGVLSLSSSAGGRLTDPADFPQRFFS